MSDIDQHDIDYSKSREAAERYASAMATDTTVKTAHKKLAALYGDRVVAARKAINLETAKAVTAGSNPKIVARSAANANTTAIRSEFG
jgi:hypothetical protein